MQKVEDNKQIAEHDQKEQNTFGARYLLRKGFDPPVLLATYDGIKLIEVSDVEFDGSEIHTTDDEVIRWIDVCFARSYTNKEIVDSGITVDARIQAKQLRMPEEKENFVKRIKTATLWRGMRQNVRITLLDGHVLRGYQRFITKHNIVLKIKKKTVLVYRHAILKYIIEGENR